MVQPALAAMTQASDPTAAVGAGGHRGRADQPGGPQLLNSTTYSVSTYLGTCKLPVTGTNCTATGPGITQLRAVVALAAHELPR